MKTLLAFLPLALSGQLPAQGSEQTAPALPAESPRMTIIRFEGRGGCFLRSPSILVRVRENFDDKVMQSADEM